MRLYELFLAIGEYYAAGFFENPNESYMRRAAHALRCQFELCALPEYTNTKLYPVIGYPIYNPHYEQIFSFFYPHSLIIRRDPKCDLAQQIRNKATAAGIALTPQLSAAISRAMQDPALNVTFLRGWTHSVINYERILNEGLGQYLRRIDAKSAENPEFFEPLRETLTAIQYYIRRCEAMLRKKGADALADIFHQMIDQPAKSLYDAFVYYNFFWFIDDRDTGGRMDAVLDPFRHGESDDDIIPLFREHWLNYENNGSWHATFSPHLNWLKPALIAQRGLSRPGSSVLIDDDTPMDAWNAIFDSWASGNTNPSLYFKANYTRHLDKIWNVRKADFDGLSYGGCTELMIMGKSNVGSTDGNLEVLEVLSNTDLLADSFEAFYARLLANIREKAKQSCRRCEVGHEMAALYQPNLIRTLFTEDCIDTQTEFNDCGARYNSGLIGICGLTNLVNAVDVIRRIYNGTLNLTLEQLAEALEDNFEGHELILKQIQNAPKFGNDNAETDAIAKRVIHDVADAVYSQSRPHRTYIPFINLFTTYAYRGSYIPATADGRLAGAPVGDSFGAVQGTDTHGPTALLNSVTIPAQYEYLGTPVMNLRLQKEMIATPENRTRTIAMLMAYFHRGGLQIQVSILDAETLRKAYESPQDYPNLMVRIGGYSEYFCRLNKTVQQEVIKRSEHTL